MTAMTTSCKITKTTIIKASMRTKEIRISLIEVITTDSPRSQVSNIKEKIQNTRMLIHTIKFTE
jgi:hypothetical protein